MGKRKNVRKINRKIKQQKIAIAVDVDNQRQSPPIFKLHAICCDDLFDFLSLKDLYSLGLTCKRMQRLTGIYFQENYFKNDPIYLVKQNIEYIGFRQFFQSIKLNNFSQKIDYQFAGKYCDSLRSIQFHLIELTKSMIDDIQIKLNQIETINLISTGFSPSFNLYKDFLKFCPNLKNLYINGYKTYNPNNCNEWMYQKYSKLEHLEFFCDERQRRISNKQKDGRGNAPLSYDFGIFLQKNPHLKSFETLSHFLLSNSDTFVNSKTNLQILTIRYNSKEDENDLNDVCILLNKMSDNNKKLKFGFIFNDAFFSRISQDQINQIGSFHRLVKLYGDLEKNLVLPNTLKVLSIYNCDEIEDIHLEKIAVSCQNLHRVDLNNKIPSENQMLPFIRWLPRLREIRFWHWFTIPETHEIDLSKMNEERKKLVGACKVTLYLEEPLYLKIKMSPKNLYNNYDLIEIKRSDSVSVW